jgi:histidinol-phosphate aminotransferase
MGESIVGQLVRQNIKELKAYKSARGTAKAMEGVLLLDAAENPFTPFDETPLAGTPADLNRYPEPQPVVLRETLAEMYGVQSSSIVLTRGSEEGIRLLLQVFCNPREDAIISCPPTFGMYPIESQVHDINNIQIPRKGEDFSSLDIEKIVATAKDAANKVKMLFVCNPGNPASTSIPTDHIDSLIEELGSTCMVVLDEAYIEFAGHRSFASRIAKHPNVIVLRTLSKSYGLAGVRLGAIIGSAETADYVRKMIAAYPVPRSTLYFVEAALEKGRREFMLEKHALIKEERNRMVAALSSCSIAKQVLQSDANFLCVIVAEPAAVVSALREQGILVRDRSTAIPGALNVAVGTAEQNEKVIKAFQTLG